MTNLTPEKRARNLRISIFKGGFGCCMTGFTQEYFTPFILFLGAQSFHIGILNSAANFLASIVQLKSADFALFLKSRKKMVGLLVVVQMITILLMVLFPFLGFNHFWTYIVLIIAFTTAGAFFIPAWLSILADLVDQEKRGGYFGWRSRTLGLLTVGMMAVSGIILHFSDRWGTIIGFLIIFSLAFLCRGLSLFFLNKMDELPVVFNKEDHFTFFQFFRNVKRSNFAKFVLFVSLMNFSVNLSAPFFAVLMINDLHFDYLTYTLIIMSAPFTLYLVVQRWGQHADRVGNLKILRMTAFMISFVPILWILNRQPFYLMLVEMFSGFLWAGFNLCSANFIYDAVTPPKRMRCISYFNVVNGTALALGALIGGFVIKYLPPLSGHKILMLFLISSIMRLSVAVIMPRMLKEVRPVEPVKSADLFFSMINLRPIQGVNHSTARVQG